MADSKLFRYLGMKNVNVIMKSIKGSQSMSDGTIIRGNVVISGYLIDEDDTHYYLGPTIDEVTEAIVKDDHLRFFIENDGMIELIEIDEDDNGGRH